VGGTNILFWIHFACVPFSKQRDASKDEKMSISGRVHFVSRRESIIVGFQLEIMESLKEILEVVSRYVAFSN